MKLCRNGLHDTDVTGWQYLRAKNGKRTCLECSRATGRRWRLSPQGKAWELKYDLSGKRTLTNRTYLRRRYIRKAEQKKAYERAKYAANPEPKKESVRRRRQRVRAAGGKHNYFWQMEARNSL